MLNFRIIKLEGYMEVFFEASPTKLSYAKLTTKESLLLLFFSLKMMHILCLVDCNYLS